MPRLLDLIKIRNACGSRTGFQGNKRLLIVTKKANNEIKKARKRYKNDIGDNTKQAIGNNPKQFWTYLKPRSTIQDQKGGDGKLTS